MREFVVETWPTSQGLAPQGLASPVPRWPSRRAIGQTVWIVVAAALIAGAAIWIARATRPLSTASSGEPGESAPAWQDIGTPVHIYGIEAPDFTAGPLAYAARRHIIGGGREDVLSLGAFDGTSPALRLRIFRRAAEAPSPTPLFAALAHEAAAAGLAVGRSGLPEILPTRFGRFEIADLSLVRPDDSAAIPCSGLRLILDEPAMSITGLACGGRTAPLTRTAIGCLVERLDLAAAGDDRALADFFAKAEQARSGVCAEAAPRSEQAGLDADRSSEAPKTGKAATARQRLRRR